MISIISAPSLAGTRSELVLAEDNLGHYPEFRAFFSRTFDLDHVGLGQPGYVQTASGAIYALVFIGRSGEPFPSGVEIRGVVRALEPMDEVSVDRDLWAIMHWMIEGVGGDWTVEALTATGRLFKIPAGMDGNLFRS